MEIFGADVMIEFTEDEYKELVEEAAFKVLNDNQDIVRCIPNQIKKFDVISKNFANCVNTIIAFNYNDCRIRSYATFNKMEDDCIEILFKKLYDVILQIFDTEIALYDEQDVAEYGYRDIDNLMSALMGEEIILIKNDKYLLTCQNHGRYAIKSDVNFDN